MGDEKQRSGFNRVFGSIVAGLRSFNSFASASDSKGQGESRRTTKKTVALRWNFQRKRELLFWAIVSLSAFFLYERTRSPKISRQVLLLAREVPNGATIQLGDLALGPREAGGIEERFLERVQGASAARLLAKGTALEFSDLQWGRKLRSQVPPGTLAYPIELPQALTLEEGDFVDLFPADARSGEGSIQAVRVLDARLPRVPILALRPEEIRWVELVQQKGKLRMAVRSEHDAQGDRHPIIPRRRKAPVIQVWENG